MYIVGVDIQRSPSGDEPAEHTLVVLDESGNVARTQRMSSLPEVAAWVGDHVGSEPFLLGVNVPVVVPAKPARSRSVENLVRRRFGFRLPAGGRAALSGSPLGVAGETLLAGLAAAGRPCLPYPDRGRRQSGLVESHPALIVKALSWEASPLARSPERPERDELFRAYAPPSYRSSQIKSRCGWAEQAVALDLALGALGDAPGFDTTPARDALDSASSGTEVERAGALLDSALLAGTARRYLASPESCVFLGDQENGYLILPADDYLRRLALSDARKPRGRLFPQASLRERLGTYAQLRSADLLTVPGRPQRTEATFREHPRYEFDNLDEMLWWKHCRHVKGPILPTEGLQELHVSLSDDAGEVELLKLVRSRHRTLSFRFEPPASWRAHVPTRDGKTYPFAVIRAIYDTLPASD